MSQQPSESAYHDWHALLDALCREQGHDDNAQLAGAFCELSGGNGQAEYDAALRNLTNWRQGLHLPHRKNFRILTALLDIDAHDAWRTPWHDLYDQAKQGHKRNTREANTPLKPWIGRVTQRLKRHPVLTVAAACLLVFLVAGVGGGTSSGFFTNDDALRKFGTDAEQLSRHEFYVKLKIGESAIIGGTRSDCGAPPPPWDRVGPGLLKLKLGVLSDGGIGRRYSYACRDMVPTRAIKFTATHKGREEFMLYSDRTIIDVE